MNVLSLFDGMSCGQLALQRIGAKVNNYFASEIDPYAIKVAKKNFPNMVHVGDVTNVMKGIPIDKVKDDCLLEMMATEIDLILAGSPCQGFSFAGKQLNFDDPRSKLFFEFIRIVNNINTRKAQLGKPQVKFLLENVRMKKESQDVITKALGVEPILINSALVSAQNRNRLYWTNIPNVTQPQDKGIVLSDILEDLPFDEPPNYLKGKWCGRVRGDLVKSVDDDKAHCLTASMWKGQIPTFVKSKKPIQVGVASDIKGYDIIKRVYSPQGKSPTLTTMQGGHREPKVAIGRIVNRRLDENGTRKDDQLQLPFTRQLEVSADTKSNCLTTVQKDNVVVSENLYRKLTPLECERLQTLPDNYTEGVSKTQRYKMIGNGWTVDVITHILKEIV
jgi:DNA (cytosine-5)-methyltransferase 3A